jgi:hypothetical protein
MDAPTVAASLSAVVAVVVAIAAWRFYGRSRSVTQPGIETDRGAVVRELSETTHTIQSESIRALALCYRRRALLGVPAKAAGIHSSSGEVFANADLYDARIREIRDQASQINSAIAATAEDLSDRLPHQQANLTDLRKIIAVVTADCDKASATFDSPRETKERDLDRILRTNSSPAVRMPWHRVVIPNSDVFSDAVSRLFNKFETAYRHAGAPFEASVFRGRSADGDHVFYFSPEASAFAGQLLQEFAATRSSETPDLTGFVTVHL